MSNTAKKYGRTYRRPEAIPYGTEVEDANGFELVRETDGWWFLEDERDDGEPVEEPLSTTDLAFPLRVILERSGGRKPRGQDRTSRRWRQKELAKAKAAKVVRQVHAAEEARREAFLESLQERP